MKYLNMAGEWILERERTGDCYPAELPGDIVSTLITHQVIPPPYVGKNEEALQWVGREDWAYRRTFFIDADFLNAEQLFLDIETLDTISEIWVNEELIASTDNAFLRYRIPLHDVLKKGENRIMLRILSAEQKALSRAEALAYPVPYTEYPIQSPHRNLVRKPQCHGGWDWGPCIMTGGVYGTIQCVASQGERIEYVHSNIRYDGKRWHVGLCVEWVTRRKRSSNLRVAVAGEKYHGVCALAEGHSNTHVDIYVENPERWYPAGYGAQNLYTLVVESDNDRVEKKIGFRELSVIHVDDERGRSFTINVNGREVFCKGANWIPMDALPARISPPRYRDLLSSARDANMNMLRVWGGGQYEQDYFYELCDELGILVWQDFMFSCALYPTEDWFLASVAEEVGHQIKRLKDHPSLALWCGNNECLGALNWFELSRKHRDRYIVDFDRLYEAVIGTLVRQIDPFRHWWPSSPSVGVKEYSHDWYDDRRGDMHYWSVWHEGKSFDGYFDVVPRFCSEFGFQSFPSLHSVKDFASKDQFNVTAPVMEHHQRHERGNSIIIESLSRYFRFPKDFSQFLYLSQVQQAVAIQTAVEHWRAQRPLCMGALYWQLNDNWPVASWSSIEYSGRWKPLHYFAKRFFAPHHIVFLRDDEKRIQLLWCNDTIEILEGECILRAMSFDGNEYFRWHTNCRGNAEAVTPILSCLLSDIPADPTEYFLTACVELENAQCLENVYFPSPLKHCELEMPTLSLAVQEPTSLRITSNMPAFYVSIDHPLSQLRFSDNCVHLLPDQEKEITVIQAPEGMKLADELQLLHLRASYE